MTFPVAGYNATFFAESDFVGCSNIQLHCFLLGQTVCQFLKKKMYVLMILFILLHN